MGTRDQKFLKLPKNSFMHIQTPAGVWNDLPVSTSQIANFRKK